MNRTLLPLAAPEGTDAHRRWDRRALATNVAGGQEQDQPERSSRGVGRVAHIVPAPFDPNDGIIGGAERYSFELARHMAERVPTRLVTFGTRSRAETVDALEVVVLRAHYVRGQRSNPMAAGLWAALRDATIVHCHQQHVVASSAAAIFARLRRTRVFATDLGGGGFDVSGYVSTDRWFTGHLHISEYSRRIAGHDGNPCARVILGGVDVDKFSPGTHDSDAVLFVGRLLPHKGVHDLIDAVPPDLPLRIVGRPMDAAYLDMLRTRAAGKSVTFVHDATDAQLVDEYRRALCVVLPSVYETPDGHTTAIPELLGQTLLEGMACGRPAICTDVASMPEVVVDGETGLVVPPNDPVALGRAIGFVRANRELAARMGVAGRRRVLTYFRWEQVVDRCLEAYGAR
jgi:glycosyltransferase involved in cell wall biosynthesis